MRMKTPASEQIKVTVTIALRASRPAGAAPICHLDAKSRDGCVYTDNLGLLKNRLADDIERDGLLRVGVVAANFDISITGVE